LEVALMLMSPRALALLALSGVAACSATDSYVGTGGAGGGSGVPGGGGSNGGTTATGSGGASSGGATVVPTGGVPGGGPGTGGSVATGGAAPTGGVATGGVATGGRATGGVATGGVATGGVPGTGGVGGIDAIAKVGNKICGETGQTTTPGYIVRSNKWNTSASGDICIVPLGDPGRTYSGFTIDSCTLSTNTDTPSAYPSMVAGWHYKLKTTGQGLPKQVSAAASIPVTWNYQAPGGKHNISFDIWLHPQTDVTAPDGGMEFMIWVSNSGGPNPAGSQAGSANVAGGSWEVWKGNVSGWQYVAYKRTSNLGSFEDLDILPILKDAVSKGYLQSSWYILGIEAGFEIWNCSGASTGTKYYSVKVN
jgi:hypothetical protein